MQKEKYIILPNKKDLSYYEKYNLNSFILPLKDYSIGCEVYFDIDEINDLSNSHEVYVLMNKFLHNNIVKFRDLYKTFNDKIKFIVEDIGLTDIIDMKRLVLYENHILSNYKAINYLYDIGIKDVVINNDLTIKEIKEIIDKSESNLYYYYIAKNNIMYSRRKLVSNFDKNYSINNHKDNHYLLYENISKKKLDIYEEDGSIVKYDKIFCASKYLSDLSKINKIIDFSYINELNERMILENIDNNKLCDLIDCDYYFLENDIKYKIGDIK